MHQSHWRTYSTGIAVIQTVPAFGPSKPACSSRFLEPRSHIPHGPPEYAPLYGTRAHKCMHARKQNLRRSPPQLSFSCRASGLCLFVSFEHCQHATQTDASGRKRTYRACQRVSVTGLGNAPTYRPSARPSGLLAAGGGRQRCKRWPFLATPTLDLEGITLPGRYGECSACS